MLFPETSVNVLKFNKGVEKAKTASRNKNVPHGRLLQMFFDVDKSFIFDTANQTEKNQ